ncbi:MAG: hypothetical protein ACOZDY_20050 [Pseudomonadota bacterium]
MPRAPARINERFARDPWDWVSAGAVYRGAGTIPGPACLGYGYAGLGQDTFYLVIGPRF